MNNGKNIKLGVSLYSYQDNYYFHKHDLEGLIAAAAGSGAEGFEIFPEAMIPEWPYISDDFVDRFRAWKERYGVEAVCLDHFADRAMWHNRQLTDDEMYERTLWYFKAANQLGCRYVRMMHNAHIGYGISPYTLITPQLIERLLPAARDYNVIMALECHAPSHIGDPIQQDFLEPAYKLGIPNVGLQADFSSYEYCISNAMINFAVHFGCSAEVLIRLKELQTQAYKEGHAVDYDEVIKDLEKMHLTEADREFLNPWPAYHESSKFVQMIGDYESFRKHIPQMVYCHAKFYDINDEGDVDNIDYPKLFQIMKEEGYQGYVTSEFEGARLWNVSQECNEIEYVRKHQELMRKCIQ